MSREKDDAYQKLLDEQNKLDAPATETARERKWRIFKNKAVQLRGAAQQGFIMGALVGGGFGFIVGCWTAVQTRTLYVIPLSTVISGASFGFFMGCGSLIRSDDELMAQNILIAYNQKQYDLGPLWRMKYD